MINFGPATITWESVNQLTNGDFELWSSGNNVVPDNWNLIAGNIAQSNDAYHNNYAAVITRAGAILFYQSKSNIASLRNKTMTVRGYSKANNANAVRLSIADESNNNTSSYYNGNNNWQALSTYYNVSNNANNITISVIGSNNFAVDYISLVEGPYTLGKTTGGSSLQIFTHNSVGVYSKNLSSLIYGGEGVLHMFQLNNSFSFNNNSSMLYDYGKLTFTCNNMTITIDCAKLFFPTNVSFGTLTHQPFDLYFSFKKSPDTGNYITFS